MVTFEYSLALYMLFYVAVTGSLNIPCIFRLPVALVEGMIHFNNYSIREITSSVYLLKYRVKFTFLNKRSGNSIKYQHRMLATSTIKGIILSPKSRLCTPAIQFPNSLAFGQNVSKITNFLHTCFGLQWMSENRTSGYRMFGFRTFER